MARYAARLAEAQAPARSGIGQALRRDLKVATLPRAQPGSQTEMADSEDPHLLIVEARFYDDLADALLDGAKAALDEAGATYDVVTVPGALEIPAAISFALDGGRRRRHRL